MLFSLLGMPFPAPTRIDCSHSASPLCGHPSRPSSHCHPVISPGLWNPCHLYLLVFSFTRILPLQILTIQMQVVNTLRSIFLEIGLVSLIIRWYSLSQTQEPSRFASMASLAIQSLCQTLESIRFREWGVPTHGCALMCSTSGKSGSSLWCCSVFLILVFIPAHCPIPGIHWIRNNLKGEKLAIGLDKAVSYYA